MALDLLGQVLLAAVAACVASEAKLKWSKPEALGGSRSGSAVGSPADASIATISMPEPLGESLSDDSILRL